MERVVGLTYYLYIPQSIEDEIKLKFTDEMEQKKQAIWYWINTDPLAGWRRLITALDEMKETQLADLIRFNAEPITGMCIALKLPTFMQDIPILVYVHYKNRNNSQTFLVCLSTCNTLLVYLSMCMYIHSDIPC